VTGCFDFGLNLLTGGFDGEPAAIERGPSDAYLADIYTYLEARPKPQPGKDIPLLNQ